MRTTWLSVVIVGGLLGLLTYLLVESRSHDLPVRGRMQKEVQALELHDAELTRDVLLARAGLLPNYDTVARTSEALAQDSDALRQETVTISDTAVQALLAQRVAALATALQEKRSAVEDFKSDNAVLRNSLLYLTHAPEHLAGRGEAARVWQRLSPMLLRYLQLSEPSVGEELQAALDQLLPTAAVDGEVHTAVRHLQLVVSLLPHVDTVVRQIVDAPTPQLVRTLQAAVQRYAMQVEARAQVFRFLLYLVAVTLVGYLVAQFARLRARARDLHQINADLHRTMGERLTVETALRTSEERLRAITESANEAIVSVDSTGNVVSWNAGATAVFGYAPDEILGTSFTRLSPVRFRETQAQSFAEWAATGHSSLVGRIMEMVGLGKDDREFPLEVSLSSWATHEDHYLTGIIRDLTERKRLEETTRQQEMQLIQANKMTALGMLISGVAHEINNPNQLVLLNAQVLADAWADAMQILDRYAEHEGGVTLAGLPHAEMRDTIPTLLRDMHESAQRIERIVNDLKNFARPGSSGGLGWVDVTAAAQRALRLLTHLIARRTTQFHTHFASDVPPIRGNAQHVEQVVVNLIVNALEALPNTTCGVTLSTRFNAEEGCVILEVEDEGSGISAEDLPRLTEPFFTTKHDRGGTGLGLAISSSLVRAHGGSLSFTSEPGRGTRARVTLPRTIPEPQRGQVRNADEQRKVIP
jgi:PAS domain S-box-containing protein